MQDLAPTGECRVGLLGVANWEFGRANGRGTPGGLPVSNWRSEPSRLLESPGYLFR
jgi:hypothetical protein